MSRLNAIPLAAAVLTTTLMMCTQARAEPHLPFSLVYTSDAGCPTQRIFERELLNRLAPTGAERTATDSYRLTVSLQHSAQSSEGSVLLERPGTSFVRSVSAKKCDDLVKALALIVSVALTAETPEITPAEPAVASEPAERSALPTPSEPTTTTLAQASAPKLRSHVSPPAVSEHPGDTDASDWFHSNLTRPLDRTRWVLLAAGELRNGLGRPLVPYPRLTVELRYKALTTFSPVVGFSIAAAQSNLEVDGPDAATLYWTDGRVHACLPSLRWIGRLALRTCWAAGAGLVRIVGTKDGDTAVATRGNRFWGDVAALVRVEGTLSDNWELSTYGGISVPFARLALATAGANGQPWVWYRSPALGFIGGLGLGWMDTP